MRTTDLLIPPHLRHADVHLRNLAEQASHNLTPDARREERVVEERSDIIKGPGSIPGGTARAHTAFTTFSRRFSLTIPSNSNLDTRPASPTSEPHFHTGVVVDTITLLPSLCPGGWLIVADIQPLQWLQDPTTLLWSVTGSMVVQSGSMAQQTLHVARGHYEVWYNAWRTQPNPQAQVIPIQFLLQNNADGR